MRRRTLAARRSVRAVSIAILVASVAVGCTPSDDAADDGGGASGGQRHLQPFTSEVGVGAGSFCAATGAAGVVDCDVTDLLEPVFRSCPEGRFRSEPPNCPVPVEGAGRRLGWRLTSETGRERRLTVYRSGDRGADRLDAMVQATDTTENPWLMATVCTSDLNGDDLLDVVVFFRSKATRTEMTVQAVDLANAPTRVATLGAQPFKAGQPQGCRSELLDRLYFDGDSLKLHNEPGNRKAPRERPTSTTEPGRT